MSPETSNASRSRYYLAFEHLKLVYEASFSSYCAICLPLFIRLRLLAIWTSPKAKLSTVDCLEALRPVIILLQDIAAQVQRNRVSKLWKLSRSLCMRVLCMLNTVDTPSWIVVSTDWLLIVLQLMHCIHYCDCCTEILYTCICSCCVCGMVDSCTCVCGYSVIQPRHLHLRCFINTITITKDHEIGAQINKPINNQFPKHYYSLQRSTVSNFYPSCDF